MTTSTIPQAAPSVGAPSSFTIALRGLASNSPYMIQKEIHRFTVSAANIDSARFIGQRIAAERGLEFWYARPAS